MSVLGQTKSQSVVQSSQPKLKRSTIQDYQNKWGYFFISPWIIGFLLFTLLPIAGSLFLSFTNYTPAAPDRMEFIGIQNYIDLTRDPRMGVSLMVTLRFMVMVVPITFGFGLLLATLVNAKALIGKNIFRTLFYMPSMIPVVAGGLIWSGIMNTQNGWINVVLRMMGLPAPDWLNTTEWIYPTLTIIGLWGVGNLMLTLLAGMQGVPNELYEAATIDGANGLQSYWYITLPLITPVVFYNLTLMIIGMFKYFDLPYVLKNGVIGAPADSTLFYNLYLYVNAFRYNLFGYASAQAWVLFIIVLVLTIFLFQSQKYWVHYAGGGS